MKTRSLGYRPTRRLVDSTFATRLCVRPDCESRRDPTRSSVSFYLFPSLFLSFSLFTIRPVPPPQSHHVPATQPRRLEPPPTNVGRATTTPMRRRRLLQARGCVPRITNEAKARRDFVVKGVSGHPHLVCLSPRFRT